MIPPKRLVRAVAVCLLNALVSASVAFWMERQIWPALRLSDTGTVRTEVPVGPEVEAREHEAESEIELEGGRSATLYTRFCDEANPDSGQLGILVMSDEFSWAHGSETKVQLAGETIEDFPQRVLSSRGLTALLDEAEEVVAVGTASCEGDPGTEVWRACDRANTLKGWVTTHWSRRSASSQSTRDLHSLNLGRFEGPCSGSSDRTRHQRRVILIAISRTPEVELGRCLREILSRTTDLRYLVDSYSHFDLDTVPSTPRTTP